MKNPSILILAIIVLLTGTTAKAKYSGGTGDPNDPYRIATAEDLNDIGNHTEDLSACFVLTNDINLSAYTGTQFNIIGNGTTMFTGIFDGNDHKIWNFTWTSNDVNAIGLFNWVGGSGRVKNLGMENVNVNVGNGEWASGLVGVNYYHGTITNCYSTGIVSGTKYVGGLVGYNDYESTIANCYSAAKVLGTWQVGGLVAENWTLGVIIDCHSTGMVDGNEQVGGLTGYNDGFIYNSYSTGSVSGHIDVGGLSGTGGRLTNCYSLGSVSGDDYVGGLVGNNNYTKITNCYSTGIVSGTGYHVGGLVGGGGIVVNSFWDIITSNQSTSAGGTPKTTAEMKQQSTFANPGWDFVEVWDIGENQTYPFLRTGPAGDLNYDKKVDFNDLAILALHWLEER
jgi:hypothetical protein